MKTSPPTKKFLLSFLIISAVVLGLFAANYSSLQGSISQITATLPKSSINNKLNLNPNYKPKYSDILNYSSLKEVKNDLTNIPVYVNNPPGPSITGYDLVLKVLNDGYNGLSSNNDKEAFFNKEFANYGFKYKAYYQYYVKIIHSLWLEREKLVPWSLKNYSTDQIKDLFWVGELHQIPNNNDLPPTSLAKNLYTQESYYKRNLSEESTFKLFLLAKKMVKSNQSETMQEIIKWQKKNFFHAYFDYTWDYYKDNQIEKDKVLLGDGSSFYAPVSLERLFDERITGCHENVLVFASLLNSLNIPAVNITRIGHGVTYLPTIDKYVHGDHLADFVTVPAEDYLLTASDMTNITGDSANYDAVFKKKYPFPQHYFTNIELHRNNKNLLLETNSVCTNIPAADWQKLTSEVLEFNLKYDQPKCLISSDLVPIQTLDQLSK